MQETAELRIVPGLLPQTVRRPRLGVVAVALAFAVALLSGCRPTPDRHVVTLAVDMQFPMEAGWFDPATESVGVRGDRLPLSWDETLTASDEDGDGTYEVTVDFGVDFGELPGVSDPQEFEVAFKFKVDGDDNPNDGWQVGPNRTIAPGKIRRFMRRFEAPPDVRETTFTGMIAVHPGLVSPDSTLPPRDVFVYIPPGYVDSERRYPVLYMHDGRNVFDASEVGAEWRMDEYAQDFIESGVLAPFIIVGVGNTQERMREYTPTPAFVGNSTSSGGGSGAVYGRFLVDDLKPLIDRTYRTLPDRDNTSLGGSSLGGLITMYLGMEYPEVFGQLLVVSPSAWWDDGVIVRQVESLEAPTGQRIWLDIGGREGNDMVVAVRELRDALQQKGWTNNKLRYVEDIDADHSERAWASRADDMLLFLYGPRR